jgi:hypothetical protein
MACHFTDIKSEIAGRRQRVPAPEPSPAGFFPAAGRLWPRFRAGRIVDLTFDDARLSCINYQRDAEQFASG